MPSFLRRFIWIFREAYKRTQKLARVNPSMFPSFFSKIRTSLKVAIKENICVEERLDYPAGEILMDAGSLGALYRLGSCAKEPETVQWIETYVKSGEVFYDVGANVGAYSLVTWKATGGKCKVYAFEPGFSNFAALCKNIILNRCEKEIVPLQVALGDDTGIFDFSYTNISTGYAGHSIVKSGKITEISNNTHGFQQPILSFRMDDFIKIFGIPPPNHVKIDVDGGEFPVLRGAQLTLRIPTLHSLLVEIDETVADWGEILKLLQECGFKVAAKHQRVSAERKNYIFTRSTVNFPFQDSF